MKSILLLVVLSSVVNSEKASFKDLPALDAEYHVKIGEKYISEIECLKKFDTILEHKWREQLKQVPTIDPRNLGKIEWEEKDSSYTRYNTFEEEWLMNKNLPAKRIDQCFRNLVSDVVPLMTQDEIQCLNELFYFHVVNEIDHQEEFESILKATSHEQLPFRKFISFTELVEILFQNRSPDAMTDLERVLYEHAESYLISENDRGLRNYAGSQDCDWENAKFLREASTDTARFAEFVRQVRSTVNKQLAGQLVKKINLNATIPRDRYDRWMQERQAMISMLEKEVGRLRKQNKDAQWLCEYATKLAFEFSDKQLSILLMEDSSWVYLKVSDVASTARAVEEALGKLNDFRHGAVKTIADQYEEGTRCFFSLLHLIQNHRKHDLASAFIDQHYSFPELYCRGKSKNFGLVQMTFCNCIGSFCIGHPLAALFADEYVVTKGPDGIYQVVRTGHKSNRKIIHCHILANGNKML